jgi:hypothetical protein
MKILINNCPSLHEHGFVEFQGWDSFLYVMRCIHFLYSFVWLFLTRYVELVRIEGVYEPIIGK